MMKPQTFSLFAFTIIIIGMGAYVLMSSGDNSTIQPQQAIAAEDTQVTDNHANTPDTIETATTTQANPVAEAAEIAKPHIDVEKAMEDRAIGNADAPIVIQEYASLSCSHCAHFYRDTFPKLKENYIDTGKVRFIYNDYPLNGPAMEASTVARCLPHDKYFKFIKFLYETQEQWAFNNDYSKNIRQNAKLLGASGDLLDACLASEELKQGIIAVMQKAADEHEIKSTPSFLVNGVLQRGALNYDSFSKIIDKMIKESSVAN